MYHFNSMCNMFWFLYRIILVGREILRFSCPTLLLKQGPLVQVSKDEVSRSSSGRLLSRCSFPSPYQCLQLLLSRCKTVYSFVELHKFSVCPVPSPVQILLNCNTLISCISYSFQFCVTCEHATGSFCISVQLINEEVKQHWTQHLV